MRKDDTRTMNPLTPSSASSSSSLEKTKTKLSRARNPKTKSGCLTCRERRIKCDEMRPACMRCVKFGVVCDGYAHFKTLTGMKPKREGQLVPIVSKGSLGSKQSLKVKAPKEEVLELGSGSVPQCKDEIFSGRNIEMIIEVQSGSKFMDEKEGRYFRYYLDEIASEITGPYRSDLWDRFIPQAGEMEPFVRHAITALGALSRSQKVSQLGGSDGEHHHFALIQYGKALKGMREMMELQKTDKRTALMACLLAFCFESLEGRQTAASSHAAGGCTLLETLPPDPRSISNGHLEDDLYSAFASLDLQSLFLTENRPTKVHERFVRELDEVISKMPATFESVEECRMWWQLVMRRNYHWVIAARASLPSPDPPPSPSLEETEKDPTCLVEMRPGNNLWSEKKLPPNYTIPRPLLDERERCLSSIHAWEAASASLFDRTEKIDKGSEDFIVMCLVKIHAAMNIVLLGRTFFPSELALDAYLPHFQTVTSLVGTIFHYLVSPPRTGSSIPSSTFRFDLGILPALSQVAMRCRHKATRIRAMELMGKMDGYREGLWDGLNTRLVAKAVLGLEEPWRESEGPEGIREEKRARLLRVDVDLRRRWARAALRQGGEREEKVVVLVW